MDIFKKVKQSLKYLGINLNIENSGGINYDDISTIQTCIRILTENVSRLPLIVRDKEGSIVENHKISNLFNSRFNSWLSADKGRKIVEKDRNLNGNGFIRVTYDKKGKLESLTPIKYEAVTHITLKNNSLYYAIDNSLNTYTDSNIKEVVNGEEILHFTSSNINNFVGISPIKSLIFESSIRQRASETLINFYKNNAMNPIVLTSEIKDMSQIKALTEFTEKFQLESAGSSNAGKVIKLPPGMRLDTLNYKLADAELINTLKFTNEQIISAFGVPSFLMSYETTQSIENQTLEFKTFTLNNILAAYKSEIENKLLSSEEINSGFYIDFDYSVLLDADLKTKAESYKTLVTNGLCTPNEALIKLGFKTIKGEGGNKHYMQAQYLDLESNINKQIENE